MGGEEKFFFPKKNKILNLVKRKKNQLTQIISLTKGKIEEKRINLWEKIMVKILTELD